jgi:hypothetical protein
MSDDKNYMQSQTQKIIDAMTELAKDGYKGGVVLSASGQKSKNLSVSVAQALKIQAILVEGDIPEAGRSKVSDMVSVDVTKTAFYDIANTYDVSMRSDARDEAFLDTRGIPQDELEDIAKILRVGLEEIEECIVLIYHYDHDDWEQINPTKVFDYAVTDQNGEYVLETDDLEEARERSGLINKKTESSELGGGTSAIMEKNDEGTGYVLFE